MADIRFITATRSKNIEAFNADTLTGQTIHKLAQLTPMTLHVGFDSADGLAAVYNPQIDAANPDDILVFVHDDVRFDDWLLAYRLHEALEVFDVIGIAGNSRQANQRGWCISKNSIDDEPFSLGEPRFAIGVLNNPSTYSIVGPAQVQLLDGVFMAVKAKTLQTTGIRFDPQFKYHHYDLDFCRQCEQANLKMGVWPIAMTHAPLLGNIGQEWFDSGTAYLRKWGG